MSTIVCKKCGNVIELNNDEAEKEIARRVALREKELQTLIETKANAKAKELENKIINLQNERDNLIKNKTLELKNSYDAEIINLKSQLKNKDQEKETEKLQLEKKYNESVIKLREDLSKAESEKQLAVEEALHKQANVFRNEKDKLLDEIKSYKDFKSRLTVKNIGESLEQYCENQFNSQRMTAYPNAYFEKDNDLTVNKQKGDFIFRDYVVDGDKKTEIISIMFDMKNESDDSTTKHKNEEFFKKLDSDRKAKKCEYAVLVTTLEADNNLYTGITDVSYKFPKMYVVRPQCFMAIISLLRNAALKAQTTKLELEEYKKQNVDVTNFETKLGEFKDGFLRNMNLSAGHFNDAIKGIDDTIKKLEKTKKDLQDSMSQLNTANNKVQGLTMRKLLWNSPSLAAKLKADKNEE